MYLPKCEYCGKPTTVKILQNTDSEQSVLVCTQCAREQALPQCQYCGSPTHISHVRATTHGYSIIVCTQCRKTYTPPRNALHTALLKLRRLKRNRSK